MVVLYELELECGAACAVENCRAVDYNVRVASGCVMEETHAEGVEVMDDGF